MKEYCLKKLSSRDGGDIYEMLQRMPADENGFINSMQGKTFDEYKRWLIKKEQDSQKTALEDGWKVPQSFYWLYIEGKPVGMGKIRHFLTDKLLEEGGTMGYAVCPGERNKGYGKLLLSELLKEAGRLGIDRVLLTIRAGNAASLKVALANGGVIEKSNAERHYIWIDWAAQLVRA